jgi:solute carrier family 25 (mitochondrial S-adenosylmethionine transporter), member 26
MEVLRQFRAQPTKLFRGYTALAARNLPFTGLQFPMFEHLKAYFLDRRKQKKIQSGDTAAGKVDGIFERARITALSAALAGTGAAWITTPIDVIKTRIMLSAGDEAKQEKSPHALDGEGKGKATPTSTNGSGRQSALDVTRHILRNDGIRGMFRGALLRSLWTAFGSGLYLGCYEGGRHYLEERRRDSDDEGGDVVMERNKEIKRDWKGLKVGIGPSRSQGEKVGKSGWQD